MNVIYDILSEHEHVEEWRVIPGKMNDDPHSMDELKIRVAPAFVANPARVAKELRSSIDDAVEVDPRIDTDHSAEELFDALGGQIKPKRFVDGRDEIVKK